MMRTEEEAGLELSEIDLSTRRISSAEVPHQWFAALRKQAPVYWHEEPDGPASGP